MAIHLRRVRARAAVHFQPPWRFGNISMSLATRSREKRQENRCAISAADGRARKAKIFATGMDALLNKRTPSCKGK